MGLKKFIADITNTTAFEIVLVTSFAMTGGYMVADNDDIINDTVSPHRAEVMEKMDNIFSSIENSAQSLDANEAQREMILLDAIANPTDELRKARSKNYKAKISTRNTVKEQANMLANRIVNSKIFNENDFDELAKRFNEKGLSEYSNIDFSGVDGRYRDECVLEEKKELNEKTGHVLECMIDKESSHLSVSLFTMLFIVSGLLFGEVPKKIGQSDTMEKWRRETPRKKKRSLN